MAKNLVVVESPAKAKTINKYLGKDFVVKASIGHIKDLPAKSLGVDVQNNFQPDYEIIPDAGHSAFEPGVRSRLVAATEEFKKRA